MALRNVATYIRFFVMDPSTGLGVPSLTVAGNSFSSIKLSQDNGISVDIKGTITLIEEGTGWYKFLASATLMNYSYVSPVVVPATVTYQAYGVSVYTEATGDTYAKLVGALGSDNLVLISANAQDLSASLSVNAKLLGGATPTNLAQADVTGGAYALSTDSSGRVVVAATGLNQVLVDGKALPTALQVIAATTAGKVSGAGTGTEIFKGLDGATTRVTSTVDSNGNRTNVAYS
jgi:hypothetical protein